MFWFKNKEMMERYFIVWYVADNEIGRQTGFVNVKTKDQYLNKIVTNDQIQKVNKRELTDIVITNIIELNKSDHEDWMK